MLQQLYGFSHQLLSLFVFICALMVVVFISAHLERNNNNPRTRTMTRFPFSFLQCIHLFGWWIQVDEHYMFDLFPWFFSFEVDRVRETRRSELVTGYGQCNPSYIPSGRRHHGVAIEKERKTVQTALLVVYVAIHILFIDFLGYRVCFRLPFFLENFYDFTTLWNENTGKNESTVILFYSVEAVSQPYIHFTLNKQRKCVILHVIFRMRKSEKKDTVSGATVVTL